MQVYSYGKSGEAFDQYSPFSVISAPQAQAAYLAGQADRLIAAKTSLPETKSGSKIKKEKKTFIRAKKLIGLHMMLYIMRLGRKRRLRTAQFPTAIFWASLQTVIRRPRSPSCENISITARKPSALLMPMFPTATETRTRTSYSTMTGIVRRSKIMPKENWITAKMADRKRRQKLKETLEE